VPASTTAHHTKPIFWTRRELLRLCGSQAFCPGSQVGKVALSGNSHIFAIGNEQCYEAPTASCTIAFQFCPVCRPVDGSHISSHLRRLRSSARMVLGLPGSFHSAECETMKCPIVRMQKYRRLSGNPPFRPANLRKKRVLLVIQIQVYGLPTSVFCFQNRCGAAHYQAGLSVKATSCRLALLAEITPGVIAEEGTLLQPIHRTTVNRLQLVVIVSR